MSGIVGMFPDSSNLFFIWLPYLVTNFLTWGTITQISYLSPLDQPFGRLRLTQWISEALRSGDFRSLRLIVAFAKESALARLQSEFDAFRLRGGTLEAVFGIDLQGTSRQALEFALAHFNATRIWHHPNVFNTFHPKVYLFEGPTAGTIVLGSNNLTVGGTETNCEGAIRVQYTLPTELKPWREAKRAWVELLAHPNTLELTRAVLANVDAQGLLLDESVIASRSKSGICKATGTVEGLFPSTTLRPSSPSPRPRVVRRLRGTRRRRPSTTSVVALPEALVIQIVPHHNGEIFLSKSAINQHQAFFGYPFTGLTVPKVASNRPYPQRAPDPVTHWRIYDRRDAVVRTLPQYGLNTVFYQKKGEIRITVPPDVAHAIPPMSILQMVRTNPDSGLDYICDVYPPGSPQYRSLLAVCKEVMPSGGGKRRRKFGWL